jgi:hypothetical protein
LRCCDIRLILDIKFKGDEYNALVGQLRTHADKASGLPENNRKWFPDWDEQGREDLVTALLG